jgi:signal transduction histidine kinase
MDEEGTIYAVLGISRDITDRKKMEEQSYYTEKLASIGTLAAGVAHEINNPLAVILGFTDLLVEKAEPDSETYETLKTIERQGLNAKRVVENLLSFSRYSERKVEMVDVNECMRAVLKVMGNRLHLEKINVKAELEEGLPTVRGNAGEIQQVFFNLINNAAFAMGGGGDLTLTSRRLDGSVEVRVSDTGHGIRKEHRARVFEPLFTTKGVGKGTGLGLSVSYGIIANHGGAMTFDSRTIKESAVHGTTFIITLPAADGWHA